MAETINVSNVLLQNTSRQVLLLQRAPWLKRPYIWGLPGGMIDAGETALKAATRELAEEASINESEITVRGIMRFLVKMPDENVRITSVNATLLSDDREVIIDPYEHIAYRWASPEDIYTSSDLLPGVPTMISKSLGNEDPVTDLTITPGIQVIML